MTVVFAPPTSGANESKTPTKPETIATVLHPASGVGHHAPTNRAADASTKQHFSGLSIQSDQITVQLPVRTTSAAVAVTAPMRASCVSCHLLATLIRSATISAIKMTVGLVATDGTSGIIEASPA
jgi:hypothetical protein